MAIILVSLGFSSKSLTRFDDGQFLFMIDVDFFCQKHFIVQPYLVVVFVCPFNLVGKYSTTFLQFLYFPTFYCIAMVSILIQILMSCRDGFLSFFQKYSVDHNLES